MKQKQQFTQGLNENICIYEPLNEGMNLKAGTMKFWKGIRNSLLLSFVLVVVNFSAAEAQMKWGVKIGANASTQSDIGNIADDNALKAGLNVGAIAKYDFNDWFAVKSGLEYQGKGKKYDSKLLKTEVEDRLQYLMLPVKAEFSAGEKAGFNNGNRFFFATGPYFGYLLNAKQTIHEKTNDLAGLNDLDFGWSFELGFEFPVLKSNALQLSLNYDMGVSEVSNVTGVQNKSASINLGFVF